jgi:hypothetical protein
MLAGLAVEIGQWDNFVSAVQQRETEIGYWAVRIWAGTTTEAVCRVDLEGGNAPTLVDPRLPEDVRRGERPATRNERIEAALEATREEILHNLGPGSNSKFKILIYGPKGNDLTSRTVTVDQSSPFGGPNALMVGGASPVPSTPSTSPDFGDIGDDPVVRRMVFGVETILRGVERVMRMNMQSTESIITLQNRQTEANTRAGLEQGRRLETAINALAGVRQTEQRSDAEGRQTEQQAATRTALGKEAVNGIKDIIKTVLMKDLDPRMRAFASDSSLQELAEVVMLNPELREALADPAMIAALRDPEFRNDLSATLQHIKVAAQHHTEAKKAAQQGA